MELQIVTRSGEVFKGAVEAVTVTAADGELGILPGHTPLLAALVPGVVKFSGAAGDEKTLRTSAGFVTVDSDTVTVVIESLEEN